MNELTVTVHFWMSSKAVLHCFEPLYTVNALGFLLREDEA